MFSPAKTFLTLVAVLLICTGSFAQEAARPDRGSTLNRNYLVSDIENINLQNGNVQLSIPLASLPPIAGGKLSWTIGAHYNSKIWDVLRVQEEPMQAPWMPYVVDAPSASGGWTIGGQYRIEFRNSNDDFYRVQYVLASGLSQGEIDLLNNHQWWKVVLIMPDGAEHELRPGPFILSRHSGFSSRILQHDSQWQPHALLLAGWQFPVRENHWQF